MTPLERIIREQILTEGPLSVSDYMALCLSHPDHGYYTTRTPIGGLERDTESAGDFITAPEISQMFGELIGVWCIEVWNKLGKPSPFCLAECGPGRGTLMGDILRAARIAPEFLAAAQIGLVEISPTLAEQQRKTLSSFKLPIAWHKTIDELPNLPTIIVANEFLDALPIKQWVKVDNHWLERGIGLEGDELAFVTRASSLHASELPNGHQRQPDDAIFENSPAQQANIRMVSEQLRSQGGAGLLIDYGHLNSDFGETLQAVRQHKYCSIFEDPGTADLTSHVDFEALSSIAANNGCPHTATTTQGQFLLSLGLLERAAVLGKNRDQETQQSLQSAVNRLAKPDQMGDLFKVLAISPDPMLSKDWPGLV